MRRSGFLLSLLPVLLCSVAMLAQSSGGSNAPSSNSAPANSSNSQAQTPAASPAPSSSPPEARPAHQPDLEPPTSDRVDAGALEDGESSSKDSPVDLSPPPEDIKAHPKGGDVLVDEGSGSTGTGTFRYWDPHKAAKDVEVGDFYFRRKNYVAAESRYREALLYKDNDALATFRLAECLEKMERPEEAQQEYASYLKILPHGPEAEKAQKAIERLKKTGK